MDWEELYRNCTINVLGGNKYEVIYNDGEEKTDIVNIDGMNLVTDECYRNLENSLDILLLDSCFAPMHYDGDVAWRLVAMKFAKDYY